MDAVGTIHKLQLKSLHYRRDLLRWIQHAGAGHTGGSLSCVDILNVLYNQILRVSADNFSDPQRDRYIQSKGHSVEALYVVLADRGFFEAKALAGLCSYQSHYVGHPTRKVHGIEHNTGGLGHGLPVSVGIALGLAMDASPARVFTLLGDGELAEGSNWEAAMAAAHYQLDNLTAIIDCNRLQITSTTAEVMNSEPLDAKFAAFGWEVRRVDGHDLSALIAALKPNGSEQRPCVVIADTIKGKGVRFMEGVGKWHHGVPSEAEFAIAMQELEQQILANGGQLS